MNGSPSRRFHYLAKRGSLCYLLMNVFEDNANSTLQSNFEEGGGSPLKLSSFVSYFFAGALLTNAVPHLIVAATGRRNITPFGRDSSAGVNLLWSGINFVSGYLLFRLADRQEGVANEADAKAWMLPYEAGCLCKSVFGVLYSWFAVSREHTTSS